MPRLRLFSVDPDQLWPASLALLRAPEATDGWAARVLLAPSRLVARLLIREVGRARGGVANLHGLTLHDLARSMAAPRRDRWLLPPDADRALVAEFLADHPGPLGARALRPGVVSAVAASLRDLREAGLSRIDAPPASLRGLEHAAQLLEWFSRTLDERGLADDAALYEMALGGPLPGAAQSVLVHGVYDLTGVQRRLVADLGARCDVDWLLPRAPADSPARAVVDETKTWLVELAFVVAEASALPDDAAPRPRILGCPGDFPEAREVARGILAAAAEGVAFGDMALLLANPGRQAREFMDQLESAGVPIAERPRDALTERPWGRALDALCDLASGLAARSAAAAVIKERLAEDPGASLAPSEVDRLFRRAALGRPDAGSWGERLEATARGLAHEARRLEAAHESAPDDEAAPEDGGAVARLRIESDGAHCLAGIAAAVLEAVESFRAEAQQATRFGDVAGALERLVARALGEGVAAAAGREAARAVAALDRLGGRPQLGLAIDHWREQFAGAEAPPEAPSAEGDEPDAVKGPPLRRPGEGVLVVDVNHARGLAVRAAWLAGFTEGVFPAPPPPDPYLDDVLRRRIAEITHAPVRPRVHRLLETDLLFALARAAGHERLTCSWSRQDDATGAVRLPAEPFARWIEELSGAPLDPADPASASAVTRVPAQLPELRDAARPLLNAAEYDLSAATRGAGDAYLDADPQFTRRRRADRKRWRNRRFTEYDGIVGDAARPAPRFSVTQLERLAVCPLRYFLRDVLGLSPVHDSEALAAPAPADVGSVAHHALAEIFRRLIGRDAPDPERAAALAESAPRVLAAQVDVLLRGGVLGAPGLWRAEAEGLGRELARFVLDELSALRGARATVAEVETSRSGRMLAGGTEVEIKGRLDRVDSGPDRSRSVTDYKLSWNDKFNVSGKSFLGGGAALQLPLYAWLLMLEAGESSGAPGVVSEVRYAFVRPSPRKDSVSVPRAVVEQADASLKQLIGKLAATAREGSFFAVPDGGDNCRYCDFRLLCGPAKTTLERRKMKDDRYERHARLAEEHP